MPRDIRDDTRPTPQAAPAGLGGTREEAMQRLKVGFGGLVAMLLIVGLASSIMQQARLSDDPATVAAGEQAEASPGPGKNPLVDIGVVPELPGEEVIVPDLPVEKMMAPEPPADGNGDSGAPAR